MARIEIDDDLYRQMELLFTALSEEGGLLALDVSTYANIALAAALGELLEGPQTRALCIALAEMGGEDWDAMTRRVEGLVRRSISQIGAQAESRNNTLTAEGEN